MIKSMNIAWWVEKWASLHPEKVAVIYMEDKITYEKLSKRMDATCVYLQSIGIEKGDRICVMLKNSVEFLELFLACGKLGAIFVPINFRLATPEIKYLIENAGPRLFVFDEEFFKVVEPLDLLNHRPPIMMAIVGQPSALPNIMDYRLECKNFMGERPFIAGSVAPQDPEEPHVIMYTSGTTGKPKGAVLSHRKTFFNCLNADIFFKMHFDDIMLIVLPMFHSGGLFIQTAPTIYKGATMVLHNKFDPVKVFEAIERHKVTKFLGVPTIYRAMLNVLSRNRYDITSVKVWAIGGEKTSKELIESCSNLRINLRQIMGQTETSILLWASEEDVLRKPNTVGRPVFHAEVALFQRDGRRVSPGEVGEIVVRGSIMMKEYWKDPESTEETIKSGWLHTGDLAYQDQEGYFYLVDRVKDMYISGGENVYPKEVEGVLIQHPDVEEVAVVGVPDETWGEVGHAFVVPKEGATLTSEELITFCQGKLAQFKWPKKVTFVRSLPKTSLGKVQKYLLQRAKDGFFNNLIPEQGALMDTLEMLAKMKVGFRLGKTPFVPEKETVLFIHGAGCDSSVWLQQLEGISSPFNLIAIDLIGHGNSKGTSPNSISAYSAWLADVLRKCFQSKVILVGHSMGGAITMQLTKDHPELVKAIVLLATGLKLKVAPQFLEGIKNDFENMIKSLMKYAYAKDVDPSTLKAGIDLMLSTGKDTVFNDFWACDNFDIEGEAHKITQNSLIMVGDQDKLTPPNLSVSIFEWLKESRLVKIHNVGHMLMVENPKRVNKEIEAFLRDLNQ